MKWVFVHFNNLKNGRYLEFYRRSEPDLLLPFHSSCGIVLPGHVLSEMMTVCQDM